jgi:hypothetical protein
MKKYIVSFSTTYKNVGLSDFELKQIRLLNSAKKFGIQNLKKWTLSLLRQTPFYKQHKNLLDIKKGAGMWIWKPYIILDALKNLTEGDFLIYADTSLYFIEDPTPMLEICAGNNGFFFLQMDSSWKLSMLTKRDVFYYSNMDNPDGYNAPLTEAYFMIFQKNKDTVGFVEEWLQLCLDEKLITDTNFSGLENISNYKDHRGDMPLLSVLRLKKGIEGFRNPAQWGNHLKIPAFRVEGEFLIDGKYWENEIYYNSPYETLLEYDKDGVGCKRPVTHYIKPSFYFYKGLRFLSRFS